jgi:hypothetical protein
MTKKPNAGGTENGQPLKAFGTPPLLDEKLIAQLQGAVNAARRKRLLEVSDSPKQIAKQVRDQ